MTRTLSETPWQELARCADASADPALFDEWDRVWESLGEATARTARAWRSYCRLCPVAQQCLDAALANGDNGVRGGYLLRRNYSLRNQGVDQHRVAPCGTFHGYRRHLYRGEQCDACQAAAREYWRRTG